MSRYTAHNKVCILASIDIVVWCAHRTTHQSKMAREREETHGKMRICWIKIGHLVHNIFQLHIRFFIYIILDKLYRTYLTMVIFMPNSFFMHIDSVDTRLEILMERMCRQGLWLCCGYECGVWCWFLLINIQ